MSGTRFTLLDGLVHWCNQPDLHLACGVWTEGEQPEGQLYVAEHGWLYSFDRRLTTCSGCLGSEARR